MMSAGIRSFPFRMSMFRQLREQLPRYDLHVDVHGIALQINSAPSATT
jgi:hypothetical protein